MISQLDELGRTIIFAMSGLNCIVNVFHYTNKSGWNAVRSQVVWRFQASQPVAGSRPFGAYFTTIAPTPQSIRTLYKRIRIPKSKQAFAFWFTGTAGLKQLNGGRGRDRWILFSPIDYDVVEERQRMGDATEAVLREVQ